MSSIKYIRNCQSLLQEGLIDTEQIPQLEEVAEKFSVSLSSGLLPQLESEAVSRQYVPAVEELNVTEAELEDPIGDEEHCPIKGIVHRYPDRVLLKAIHVCEVYCRFCFRREKVGRGAEILSQKELDKAFEYIQQNKQIFEVILSGGDPLVMSPEKLVAIFRRLEAIDHVGVIRIHTRLPLVSPDKVNDKLLNALETTKALFIVLHCNSHEEINSEVELAFKLLISRGIPLLSQSVLLKGVNDRVDLLDQLFRKLLSLRVKPYYLHHPDKAQGTSHFRVPMAKGIELTKSLRGHLSGIGQPCYVLDIPGGYGKVPVNYQYLNENQKGFSVEDWQGKVHNYED